VAHVAQQTLGFYRDSASSDWVNISRIVIDLLEVYGYRSRYRDVQVEKDLDESAELFTSAGEFRQVFSNIFINAVDALPIEGGRIRIRVRRAQDWADSNRKGVRVTVGDTGSGIEPQHMAKIFDAFYTTKEEIGTGLGLWLSHSIVQKYGGYIRVRSRVTDKSGTVFSIFWPEGHDPKATSTVRALTEMA
jgi:signal transduction histidine kinase